MGEVQAENKKLVEPLQKAQEQVTDLQRQLFSYDKDKALLAVRLCIIFMMVKCLLFYKIVKFFIFSQLE